jgi:lysine biosynthesis protein LysW
MLNPKMGQPVLCSACGARLEVVWLDPVELDWPFDDDEGDELDEDYWDD